MGFFVDQSPKVNADAHCAACKAMLQKLDTPGSISGIFQLKVSLNAKVTWAGSFTEFLLDGLFYGSKSNPHYWMENVPTVPHSLIPNHFFAQLTALKEMYKCISSLFWIFFLTCYQQSLSFKLLTIITARKRLWKYLNWNEWVTWGSFYLFCIVNIHSVYFPEFKQQEQKKAQ